MKMLNKKAIEDKKYSEFYMSVWKICRRIPKGKVSTYGLIAKALGSKAYRGVGHALNQNPFAPDVPCHRVVNSNGMIGGFADGTEKKKMLLKSEGIKFNGVNGNRNRIADFEKVLHKF